MMATLPGWRAAAAHGARLRAGGVVRAADAAAAALASHDASVLRARRLLGPRCGGSCALYPGCIYKLRFKVPVSAIGSLLYTFIKSLVRLCM